MKTHHWLCTILIIVIVLMGIHYFTHHNGASVVGSYIPGA